MRYRRFVSAFATAALICVASEIGRALEIEKFFALSSEEQLQYRTQVVMSTIELLKSQDRLPEANKLVELFTRSEPGGQPAKGIKQFYDDLDAARVVSRQRVKDGLPRLHVESAMAVTMKRFGILVQPPDILRQVQKDTAAKP